MSVEAYRVRGPTALGRDPRRFWNLTRTLAATDWKVRFYGSALGYLWSLLRPLMLFGIVYFVFSYVVQAGAGVEHYGVILLLAMILYFFFSEVTAAGVTSMVDRESLLRKVGFPRAVVPLAVALVAAMNLALNLVVVAIFVVASGVQPRWTWLLLPIPLALMLVFATGVAMLLSALYVRYRDVRPIWEVVLQGLFYATPILYPIEAVIGHSQTLAKIALCNPIAAIIQQSRYLLVGGTSLGEGLGSSALAAIPLVILVAVTVLGFLVFDRMAPRAAEEL
ncbi:MAG: O-antigen export system permease protein RfbD [uncultured Solirubrobacteraceae bacterium]|uniref:Transport permease protein n=1 Tax=uncultured Solirubrobacteraceae bacterium TaxID=1162706 RepID=A0A6J4TUH0_9ACTN|nr:MAG: O-antigen export system permease protein RfbD [uncultured Solirubrobacteraceae bacterium]